MLSELQFTVLRKIHRDGIVLRKYRDTTMYWLAKRGYLYESNNIVYLTKAGSDALDNYMRGELPLRKHNADITARTARYLRVSRMRKAS